METKILKMFKLVNVEGNYYLPNGIYNATHSGYNVRCRIDDNDYTFEVNQGFRGINIPCVVIIKDNTIKIEYKQGG